MPKAAPVSPPEPTMLEIIKDVSLFKDDFKWVFYFGVIFFCAHIVCAILKGNKSIGYLHGCATMVVCAFGGSTLAAIMCGAPVVFVVNEALVPIALSTFTVMYLMPSLTLGLLCDTFVGKLVVSVCFELLRAHVMMGAMTTAKNELPSKLAKPFAIIEGPDPVAFIGPVIAGFVGGCGGAFMPLNKGLDPLAAGSNWRIASSIINSWWFFLSSQYPPTVAYLGLTLDWAKFYTICIFVLPPLVQLFTGFAPFGANPCVPAPPPPASADKKAK